MNTWDHFVHWLRSLFHEHGDATTGSLVGLASGLGLHEHVAPGMGDLPVWARIMTPIVASLLPVIGKALWTLIRPPNRGVAVGMRSKARALRERANALSKSGDEKAADQLRDRADNLDAEAAALNAAETDE